MISEQSQDSLEDAAAIELADDVDMDADVAEGLILDYDALEASDDQLLEEAFQAAAAEDAYEAVAAEDACEASTTPGSHEAVAEVAEAAWYSSHSQVGGQENLEEEEGEEEEDGEGDVEIDPDVETDIVPTVVASEELDEDDGNMFFEDTGVDVASVPAITSSDVSIADTIAADACDDIGDTEMLQLGPCAKCGLTGHETTNCPFGHPDDIELGDMEESDSDNELPENHPLLARYVSQNTGALVPKNKRGLTGDNRYFGKDKQRQCWVCGRVDHESNECKLKLCFFCGEPGHDSRACPEKSKICSFCKCKGHSAVSCPTLASQQVATFASAHCLRCGALGHANCGPPPLALQRNLVPPQSNAVSFQGVVMPPPLQSQFLCPPCSVVPAPPPIAPMGMSHSTPASLPQNLIPPMPPPAPLRLPPPPPPPAPRLASTTHEMVNVQLDGDWNKVLSGGDPVPHASTKAPHTATKAPLTTVKRLPGQPRPTKSPKKWLPARPLDGPESIVPPWRETKVPVKASIVKMPGKAAIAKVTSVSTVPGMMPISKVPGKSPPSKKASIAKMPRVFAKVHKTAVAKVQKAPLTNPSP